MEEGPETDRRIEVASGDLPEGVKPGEQSKAETETDNDQITTTGKDAHATDDRSTNAPRYSASSARIL